MFLLLLVASQAFASAPRPRMSLEDLDQHIWGLSLGAFGRSASDQAELQDLQRKVEQFIPVIITSETKLTNGEKEVLELLIEASSHLDPIFNRQVWKGYEELRDQLVADKTPLGQAKLDYFDIMRGPWDRQDHQKPFAVDFEKPIGAGFYPEDLDEEKLKKYIEENPEDADSVNNLVTMVQREEDGRLVAQNYSKVFRHHLEPAHQLMNKAAELTDNESLRKFLQSRSNAFLSDDYYQSDKDWMDLDSKIEVTIGPYEVYEDTLAAQKAAFESFVTITDPVESEKLSLYKSLLPEMEQNLPIPDEMKSSRGSESPIRVVDLVFSSGESRKSVQTIAFNLPNDERVRKEKGAKKVMLRNLIAAKFKAILKPIATTLMKQKQLPLLSQEAFFNNVLFHELSHSLGPAFVGNDEANGEVRAALGSSYSGLEEGKADVMGIYNILFMVKKGLIPKEMTNKVLFTYVAGLFRTLRFGVSEAHGKGAALQLNRFLEEGSVQLLPTDQKYQVNFKKLETSVRNLVRDICTWQHNGEKSVVDAVFAKYGSLDDKTKGALARLTDVAVDIKPCYPLAGEDCEQARSF